MENLTERIEKNRVRDFKNVFGSLLVELIWRRINDLSIQLGYSDEEYIKKVNQTIDLTCEIRELLPKGKESLLDDYERLVIDSESIKLVNIYKLGMNDGIELSEFYKSQNDLLNLILSLKF